MSHGSHEGDHAMAQQQYYSNEAYAGYQNNGQYYMPSSNQYTQQQQHQHIPSVASAPGFYNNANNSPLRKPSPIRRTQSFEVEETELKLIKRRSQTQISSPNLPRVQNRASRSNSSNNISPPQRQQGPSSPDYRGRNLSSRGSSPARSTSPSRRTIVNVITRPDTNLCKAICATLTAANKTTETLAIELGYRSLLPEINAFLSGTERPDGWDQVEKLLIDWMILQNTSGGAQNTSQVNTSSAINHEAAIITNPKQNPVASASPGKLDHWIVDTEEQVGSKYFTGNQMSSAQNPYYSTSQQGTWAAQPQQHKQAQQYVENYRHSPRVNQNGYREPIHQHNSQINFPPSPGKNSAQQIHTQKQQFMNGSPREDERAPVSPASWQTQNRPMPNPQPIFSSPRDQNGMLIEKQYSANTSSANGFPANNMYINQQHNKMPQSQAPHLQQPAAHQQHHASMAPHLRNSANFENSYQNDQQMAQLSIAEPTPLNNRANPFYTPYDHGYGYDYTPMEANETHQQPQPIVNNPQGAVMRRY